MAMRFVVILVIASSVVAMATAWVRVIAIGISQMGWRGLRLLLPPLWVRFGLSDPMARRPFLVYNLAFLALVVVFGVVALAT